MSRRYLSVALVILMILVMAVSPALAGSGPGPLPEPPDGGGEKPGGTYDTYEWFPGDPAELECERVGGGDYPYALRIGTGSAQEPYGLTRDVYGNTIAVEQVWEQGLEYPVAFNWTSDPDPIGIVIVKSGRAANVYYYEDEATWHDEGLEGVEPWEPSHLTFCWGEGDEPGPPDPPGPSPCEWVEETAWGAGDPYVEQGNWALYTSYATELNILIFAGQGMEAGYLVFSEPDNEGMVTITITLLDGWKFAAVEENVKIQPYDEIPPAENPAPGLFDYKATARHSPFSIQVPLAPYYGIHLDVAWESCP